MPPSAPQNSGEFQPCCCPMRSIVAKTSGGQFFTDQKLVKVTIGGCGG